MTSFVPGEGSPTALRDRLASFQRSDQERHQAVKQLIDQFEDLENKYNKICTDYEIQGQTLRDHHEAAKKSQQRMEELEGIIKSTPLVFMIIDGDGALFNNNFLAKGERGGAEAAHQLQRHIEKYIQANCSTLDMESARIFVCLNINMAGMASIYEKHGLLETSHDFASFMRSFCVAQPLFSVVDVGHGKERADHKCRQLFDTMIRVPHCKHIIFGPCHDTGYVTVLESYRLYTPKITLLETTPAHARFRELGYKLASFKEVFRSDPLLGPNTAIKKTASSTTPSMSRYPTPTTTQPKSTWASSAKGSISFSNPDAKADAKPGVKTKYALLNALGQRLDKILPKWDYEDTQRFKQKIADHGKNFCNGYHLRGKCESTDSCA